MKEIPISSGKLLISSVPSLEELAENGPFDVIWNLADELSFYVKDEALHTKKILFGGIEDFSTPSNPKFFKKQLMQVVRALKNNGKVLIHCLAGRGRTGLALACIKIYVDGYSPDDALDLSKQYCNGPESSIQKEFVRKIDQI